MLKNIILTLLLLGSTVYAGETTRPVFLNSVRSQGMGGTGVVSTVGTFAFQYNPALLATGENNFTLAGVQTELSSDFFKAVGYLIDHSDDFKKTGRCLLSENYRTGKRFTPRISSPRSGGARQCLVPGQFAAFNRFEFKTFRPRSL